MRLICPIRTVPRREPEDYRSDEKGRMITGSFILKILAYMLKIEYTVMDRVLIKNR